MIAPIGKCPLCETALSQEGDLLVCPAGDYEANRDVFEDRWQRYEAGIDQGRDRAAAIESLLADLRALNRVEL